MARSRRCQAYCRITASAFVLICIASAHAATIGPVPAAPTATLYLVGDGEPCVATVSVKAPADAPPPRLLLRAFDADERLSTWHYV